MAIGSYSQLNRAWQGSFKQPCMFAHAFALCALVTGQFLHAVEVNHQSRAVVLHPKFRLSFVLPLPPEGLGLPTTPLSHASDAHALRILKHGAAHVDGVVGSWAADCHDAHAHSKHKPF